MVTIAIECLNRETNPRVLIHRKVKRLQKELNRTDLKSCYDSTGKAHSKVQIIMHGIVRPLKMLLFSPIISLLALYSKPHTILLFPCIGAESIGAVSGAVIIPLSLCLRSQDSSEALGSFIIFLILQC